MVAHPRVLPVQHFARVAAGSEHSVALTTTGNVWAWGSNRYGEVGESPLATCGCGCSQPCPVTCPQPVKSHHYCCNSSGSRKVYV